MEIFKLFGSILIEDKDAMKAMDNVDKKGKNLGDSIGETTGKVNKIALGVAAAASAAGAGLLALAGKSAETAAAIDDVSQRTGISAKKLQEFKYAAEMSGFSIDTIEGAAKKFTATLGNVAEGNEKTADMFKKLGVSVTNSNGSLKSTDELFPQVLEKLADMGNETERNALLMDLFGKSGMDMAPLLNGGAAGIKQLTDEAHKLGLVMSDEAIESGAQFDDTLTQLKASAGAIGTQLGAGLLPTFQKLADWVIANMPQIQQTAGNIFKGLGDAIEWVKNNSDWLIPVLGGVLGSVIALNAINGIITLMNIWKASTFAQTIAQEGLNFALKANPIGLVITAIGLLVAAGIYLWKNWDTVKAKAIEIFGAIKGFIGPIIDGIANGFKGMVNGVIKGLNFMVRALNKIHFKIPDWVPGLGGKEFGFKIPEIPSFEVGTRYLPKDMLIQAHKGEMIVPESENPYANSGGSVIPSGNMTVEVPVMLDGKVIAKVITPIIDTMQGSGYKLSSRGVGL